MKKLIMKNNQKIAFTLAEVLLTLVVIGILAGLVIPGMLKDIHAKSRMSILLSTVLSIEDMIHKEIAEQRTDDISITNIVTSPANFLAKFDTASSGTPFADSYKSYDGTNIENATIPDSSVVLKNGVGIGIENNLYSVNATGIVIDVNGEESPNIVGVDYFIAEVLWDNDPDNGLFAGDIHGYINGADAGTETNAGLKTSCRAGNAAACYRLAELTGYNPEYID